MITLTESKENLRELESCLDSEFWHVCAGGMVQMPTVNSKVFYFAQGHSEHAQRNVNFSNFPEIPSHIHCRVSGIKFMADTETDEVFAKIRLVPISGNDIDFDEIGAVGNDKDQEKKPKFFVKTLTQSDANNGGAFSVPKFGAENIFPRLDYTTSGRPEQTLHLKDVHGKVYDFKHIFRGTPRRHLLTTGWSTFVNEKRLVAGDSIVFFRAESRDFCVGIRRRKRGFGGGIETQSGWNLAVSREKTNVNSNGRLRVEDVIEATNFVASGRPFEVVYYPRAGTPEFCVKADRVKQAMQIHWCPGIRFKMAFETEDSSRLSWFMGTVVSVHADDPTRWPGSLWRLLQVSWDEPDLLQSVKRVSPWLVELVSNIPTIHISPFSPPHKKIKLLPHQDYILAGKVPLPSFSGNHHHHAGPSNLFGNVPANTFSGMQGARHFEYTLSLPNLHSIFSKPFDRAYAAPNGGDNHRVISKLDSNGDAFSCLTIGNSSQESKSSDHGKETPFVLFGQIIVNDKQISDSSSDGKVDKIGNTSDGSESTFSEVYKLEDNGHCKVFFESEDVGQTLDLYLLGSYFELYRKLADMFGIQASEIRNRVLYWDAAGAVGKLNDEPFSEFVKRARRLTILADSSSDKLGVYDQQ